MIKPLKTDVSNNLFFFTILFLIITDLAVLLNIPVLRQLLAFVFLTFVPGFLILATLKLNKLGATEKIVLSVGLSVAFVMLYGLLGNFAALALGYSKPLSTIPLLVWFGIATLVLSFTAYQRNKGISLSLPGLNLTAQEKLLLIVPALFPLLSIVGMRVMNAASNNLLLMVLLLLIPAYVVFIAVYQKNVPERLYPPFVFLIGLSILLLMSLRSNHIIGSDIHEAYYFFQTTIGQHQWSVSTPSLTNSLLSISLLPAVYQVFLNLPSEYLFKVLWPLLFSVSPLVVFLIAEKYVGSFYAFLSSFFFMSQFSFLETTGIAQTNMAILFFALAIMVHFEGSMNEFARRMFFLIFAASSVVSHYSTSIIFFFVLLLTWIGVEILSRILLWKSRKVSPEKAISDGIPNDPLPDVGPVGANHDSGIPAGKAAPLSIPGISITTVLLLFTVIFFWHAQIVGYAFNSAVGLIYRTLLSMKNSFLIETKGSSILGAFAQTALPTIPQRIRFFSSWLTVIFVAVGGLSVALRYKSAVLYPGSSWQNKLDSLKSKFELEYFVMSAIAGVIMSAAVILPYISVYYSLDRTYFQVLVVLSPFFVICGIMIGRLLGVKPYLILLPVLLPFFMCVTGTMYNLFNTPASILLNSEGTEYRLYYVHDRESYAAEWLGRNAAKETIHTDYGLGPRILASQGKIPTSDVHGELITEYQNAEEIKGYLYLFYPAVIRGEAALPRYAPVNISPAPALLIGRNKLYTAGLTDIYWSP